MLLFIQTKTPTDLVGVLAFDWDVCLDGKGNTTRATTLEDDVRTEVSNEHLAKVDGLHLELLREMLDGEALTILGTSNESVEVDLGRVSS